MPTIATVTEFLECYAPSHLAEEWDNVGLLVGDSAREIRRMMTCLTITEASAAEAIAGQVDLIVAHHPLPFRAIKRLTTQTTTGRLLLDLIRAQVAVYSAHTAFDSAPQGINQRLAEGLNLQDVATLLPSGSGRHGALIKPIPIQQVADRLKQFLSIDRLQMVAPPGQMVQHVALGCGAADELLGAAIQAGCDCMVLGEARFHTCLESQASGVGLLLPGHFASERFALDSLAHVLKQAFPSLEVWASQQETSPLWWY